MRRVPRLRLLVPALALLSACSTNPVTQRPEVIFVSEEDEIAAGEEGAQAVAEQMGLVDDPELAALVREVGERVAAHAPRTDIAWRFAVVDMDAPNAFALPGGWIYVSRGVLQLANSEDELANVLAHEVVHVAARHHAQRHARATGVGLLALPGLLVGSILPGVVGDAVAAPFALVGAGAIARYGRDQELEADQVGQRIAAAAGYDPAALTQFLESLTRDTALRVDEPLVPSWFDSHPSTEGRARRAESHAQSIAFTPGAGVTGGRAAFLRRVEGVLVGENPAEGLFEGQRFLHPDMRFTVVFPEGWHTANSRAAVGAVSPERDARVVLTLAGSGDDPREAASAFFAEAEQKMRIDVARLDGEAINGLQAVRGQAVASGGGRRVNLDLTWVAHRGSIYRIAGVVPEDWTEEHGARFEAMAGSFRELSEAERAKVRETRLRVVDGRSGEGLEGLSSRTGNAWSAEQTAVANGLPESARLSEGALVKIAHREPYRSAQ